MISFLDLPHNVDVLPDSLHSAFYFSICFSYVVSDHQGGSGKKKSARTPTRKTSAETAPTSLPLDEGNLFHICSLLFSSLVFFPI